MEIEQYSQYDEQEKIKEFFGSYKGNYLDVGAACGIEFSNVYPLLLDGWSGTSVEASAFEFRKLQINYRPFKDRVNLVNAVVSDQPGFIKFYTEGQLSTTSHEHMKLWEPSAIKYNWDWDPSINYAITINQLLEHLKVEIDFLTVDIEGTNEAVIKSINWDLLPKCKLICVEHEEKEHTYIEYMKQFGFTPYHRTSVNLLMSR
jgi:FkbM family methyltransferase